MGEANTVRLLIGFVAVCVLMFAALAWRLAGWGRPDTSGPGGPPAAPGELAAVSQAVGEKHRPDQRKTLVGESSVSAPDQVLPAGHDRSEPEAQARARSEPEAQARTAPDRPHQRPEAASSQPGVRWPTEPRRREAQRRLAAARAALRDDPWHERALRDQVAALAELGRWREAAETLACLVQLNPDDADLRFEQAAVLLRLRRWVEAVGVLNMVVAQRPEHARAWFNLAAAHQALGHLHDAHRAWNRTIELAPSPEAHAQRGIVLLDLNDWTAAAADFRTVLQHEPEAADATVNLALALWKLGRVEEARGHLLGLLERHPRHVPALNRLAEMAWAVYQAAPAENEALREETVAWCRRALAIDPYQPAVQALLDEAVRAGPDNH